MLSAVQTQGINLYAFPCFISAGAEQQKYKKKKEKHKYNLILKIMPLKLKFIAVIYQGNISRYPTESLQKWNWKCFCP